MAVHELKIKSEWFERVLSGEKSAEVRKHDRDFQVGDLLHLFEVTKYGRREQHWVERDERGRFVNQWVDNDYIEARVTHVLDGRMVDGLADDYCVLSIGVAS